MSKVEHTSKPSYHVCSWSSVLPIHGDKLR